MRFETILLKEKEFCLKIRSTRKKWGKKRNISLVFNPQMKFWLITNKTTHIWKMAKPVPALPLLQWSVWNMTFASGKVSYVLICCRWFFLKNSLNVEVAYKCATFKKLFFFPQKNISKMKKFRKFTVESIQLDWTKKNKRIAKYVLGNLQNNKFFFPNNPFSFCFELYVGR